MHRLYFLFLFLGFASSFQPARISRRNPTVARWTSPDISSFVRPVRITTGSRRPTAVRMTSPDDPVVFAAQFDPVQFVTAGSILTTFFFVQRRINRSNALLESLKLAKDELKKVRNEALSGTNDAEKISELGLTIKQLEQEWRDTATLRLPGMPHNPLSTITCIFTDPSFIFLAGYTVRYRVQRPELIPEEDNVEVIQTNDSPSQSTDVSSKISTTNNNEPFQFKDITPFQAGLLVVGVVVVSVQVWLLTLLSVDPMAAPMAPDYNPLNLPPPQPLLDSFKQ